MAPVHIGNDEIVALAGNTWPTIQEREYQEFQMPTFGLLCANFGAAMQTYGGDVVRSLHHAGEQYAGWYGVPNPSPAPEPQQPPAPEPVVFGGPLRVEGNRRWFRNERGRFDWRETMAFGLAGKARKQGHQSIVPFVDDLTRRRFNVFQVITALAAGGYWDSRSLGPGLEGTWEALDATIDMCAVRGAYTRLVIFGGLDSFGAVSHADRRDTFTGDVRQRAEDWARQVVDRYKDHPAVLFSVANEPDQVGFRNSFDKLIALGSELKRMAPGRLLCFGGHTKEGDTVFMRGPADYQDVHLARQPEGVGFFNTPQGREFWPNLKRSGENPNIDQEVMPFVHGEPPNYGDPPPVYGRPFRADIDASPASAFCAAATARARQYNQTFHWDGGLFADMPPPLTQQCMEAYHRGLDAFPMTEGGTKWRGHWGESFFRKDIYPSKDDRDTVLAHVHANRGPWRLFGIGNVAATILEPATFDMLAHATAPARMVDRIVHGRYASGVYVRG